jgi:putative transcriptional regulator
MATTVKVTSAMVQQALQDTDWAAIDAQTDEDIARNVADDPDAAPILSEAETASAIARAIRKRLGISQAEFSARYHVPIGTLRDWEQNRKQPDAPALAYLRVIAREPGVVGALSKKIAPIPTVEVDRVVRGENQLDGPANDRAVFIDLRKSIGMTDFVHPVCDLPRGKALAL